MSTYLCHDFKTPRTDGSKRLPNSMRIVPLIFYVVTALSGASAVRDVLAMNKADERVKIATDSKTELVAKKTKLDEEVTNIKNQQSKSESLAKWVEGTRIVQPLAVAISRAIPLETDITSLLLERNTELPGQMALTLNLTNGGMAEFAKIESSLARLNYRVHSPQQDKTGESVQLRSTLVFQNE